jgi:hypothetical protein
VRLVTARRLAAIVGFAAVAACGMPPSPMATTGTVAHFDLAVPDALAYFEERTLACAGPQDPFPDVRLWLCDHRSDAGTRLRVLVSGDQQGVTQLVGIASGLDVEESASFLVSTVASLAAPNAAIDLDRWSLDRAADGGVVVTGGALIELRPPSARRAVIVTPAEPD